MRAPHRASQIEVVVADVPGGGVTARFYGDGAVTIFVHQHADALALEYLLDHVILPGQRLFVRMALRRAGFTTENTSA